jgi:sulfatase maturation enzyme AslB (radical SAM superfamily)
MWSHFEEVNLSLSIDGGKEINEYIRHPINHDDLLTNYKLLAGSPDNIKVRLQIAVGALNIFELDKITQYSKEFNFLTLKVQKNRISNEYLFITIYLSTIRILYKIN